LVTVVNKFGTLAPNVCVTSVWKLLNVTPSGAKHCDADCVRKQTDILLCNGGKLAKLVKGTSPVLCYVYRVSDKETVAGRSKKISEGNV
jgi:hypothetical protein